MRRTALVSAVVLFLLNGAAWAQAKHLPLPPPPWYTEEVHQRVLQAGPQGVEVPVSHEDAPLVLDCLGFAPVSASAPGASAFI